MCPSRTAVCRMLIILLQVILFCWHQIAVIKGAMPLLLGVCWWMKKEGSQLVIFPFLWVFLSVLAGGQEGIWPIKSVPLFVSEIPFKFRWFKELRVLTSRDPSAQMTPKQQLTSRSYLTEWKITWTLWTAITARLSIFYLLNSLWCILREDGEGNTTEQNASVLLSIFLIMNVLDMWALKFCSYKIFQLLTGEAGWDKRWLYISLCLW